MAGAILEAQGFGGVVEHRLVQATSVEHKAVKVPYQERSYIKALLEKHATRVTQGTVG